MSRHLVRATALLLLALPSSASLRAQEDAHTDPSTGGTNRELFFQAVQGNLCIQGTGAPLVVREIQLAFEGTVLTLTCADGHVKVTARDQDEQFTATCEAAVVLQGQAPRLRLVGNVRLVAGNGGGRPLVFQVPDMNINLLTGEVGQPEERLRTFDSWLQFFN